jgi:hypothetical protein
MPADNRAALAIATRHRTESTLERALFRVWVRDGTGDEKLPTTGRVCEDHRRWAAWQDSQVVGSVAVGI